MMNMVNGLMIFWHRLKRTGNVLSMAVSCLLALGLSACSGDGIGVGSNTAPSVNLEVNQATGPAPLTVSFESNATDDNDDELTYVWNPGEGSPVAGGSNYTHTYLEPGSYTATVTVSDGDDVTIDSVTITVAGEPLEVNLTASPSTGSTPLSVVFAATTTGTDATDLTYTFDFGNGDTTALNGGSALNYTYTYTEPGVYEAQVLARNAEGELARSSIVITINEPAPPRQGPTAILSASAVAGAAPLSVNFDASASTDDTGSITAYTWTFGDGNSANGIQVNYIYEQDGEFTAVLTVTNNNGEIATARQTITVGVVTNQPPTASFSSEPATGTAPLTAVFNAATSTDNDGNIVSYTWNFGDGNVASGPVASNTFTTAGTFPVTLLVVDDDGASAVASEIITVTSTP